jgi:hypothetical protein
MVRRAYESTKEQRVPSSVVPRPNSVADARSVRNSVTQSRYSFVYAQISFQAVAYDQIWRRPDDGRRSSLFGDSSFFGTKADLPPSRHPALLCVRTTHPCNLNRSRGCSSRSWPDLGCLLLRLVGHWTRGGTRWPGRLGPGRLGPSSFARENWSSRLFHPPSWACSDTPSGT